MNANPETKTHRIMFAYNVPGKELLSAVLDAAKSCGFKSSFRGKEENFGNAELCKYFVSVSMEPGFMYPVLVASLDTKEEYRSLDVDMRPRKGFMSWFFADLQTGLDNCLRRFEAELYGRLPPARA